MTIPALVSVTVLPVNAVPTRTLVAVVTDLTDLKRRDEIIAQGILLRNSFYGAPQGFPRKEADAVDALYRGELNLPRYGADSTLSRWK